MQKVRDCLNMVCFPEGVLILRFKLQKFLCQPVGLYKSRTTRLWKFLQDFRLLKASLLPLSNVLVINGIWQGLCPLTSSYYTIRVIQSARIMPHAIADEGSTTLGSFPEGSFDDSAADPAQTDVGSRDNQAASGPVNGDQPLCRTGDDAGMSRIGHSGSSTMSSSSSFANYQGPPQLDEMPPGRGKSTRCSQACGPLY